MSSDQVCHGQQVSQPVIDEYVTSDLPLGQILRNQPSPRDPLVQVSLDIQDCLDGKRLAKDAIQAAQRLDLKNADSDLLVIMLSSWAELYCRIGRPADAEPLLHRTKSLISESTRPEIRAAALLVESIVAETIGNQIKKERLLRDILELLPSFSPRRKLCLWELTLLLAHQGRGIESQPFIKEMTWQCNERFPITRISLVQFVNDIEVGRVSEAARLLPQLMIDSTPRTSQEALTIRAYRAILMLMQGGMDTRLLPGSRPAPEVPNSVRIAYSLLIKDTQEALRLARLEATKLRGSIFGVGFESFSLVRAELASGNADSAVRLLKMRAGRGNKHYLDDFFFARAHFLLKNTRDSARCFSAALQSIEQFQAKARLDFELKLAAELSQGDILRLSQSAGKLAIQQAQKEMESRTPGEFDDTEQPLPAEALGLPHSTMNMILGSSTAMSEIREAISRFADLDAPVLITGETGTGKDLVARALHEASRRRRGTFTPVNCGSLTETLLESELFGHERGAFTGADKASKGLFEETGDGTILLDEIGDISPRLQATLLRVLETGEIRSVGSSKTRKTSCRIIAATNVDLEKLAEEGRFRKDLIFRLQRLLIHVPPLRERRTDIMPLARHFLDIGRRIGVHAQMSRELRDAIRNYDWPGNVRELKNVLERMRLMHSDKLWYDIDDVDIKFKNAVLSAAMKESGSDSRPARPGLPPPREPVPINPPARQETLLQSGTSTIRRTDRLRDLFVQHKKLTRGEIMEILDISANTATKYLKDLCDEGFVERVEPSASTRSHYFTLRAPPTQEPGTPPPPPKPGGPDSCTQIPMA